MLSIARRMADRLGIDPELVFRVKSLGGASGQTLGGRIFLDPKAFRAGFDARLGRMVSPLENLKRTLIHERAHVLQSLKHPDAYWSGQAAIIDAFEKTAYRFEDFWYGAMRRAGR